ncbi:hypothetical protein XCR_1241 [Xanthomonas campestris pv. raphani 756C]|nr:hypothetical protein XCR_1241 [Xanthomonas campestris pv. raphani 756C]
MAQLQQPVNVIRHQYPGKQGGICGRCFGKCATRACSQARIVEQALPLVGCRGEQVAMPRKRMAAAA